MRPAAIRSRSRVRNTTFTITWVAIPIRSERSRHTSHVIGTSPMMRAGFCHGVQKW